MELGAKIHATPLSRAASALLARPLLFIVAGLAIIGISTVLLFGGSGNARDSEKAMDQAQRAVSELAAAVESFRRLLGDEQVRSLAVMALENPDKLAELRSYVSGRVQGDSDVQLFEPEAALNPEAVGGDSRFIVMDMLLESDREGMAPVQLLRRDGRQWLAAATVVGDAEEPHGFLLVLADPATVLGTFDVTLPEAGYIALRHEAGTFAAVNLKEFGGKMPANVRPVRLTVPNSLLQVVIPQAATTSGVGTLERLLLFLLGAALLAFGVFRRQTSLHSEVEFQPDPDAISKPARVRPAAADAERGDSPSGDSREAAGGAERPSPAGESAPGEQGGGSERREVSLPDIHHELEKRRSQVRSDSPPVELTAGIFRAYDIRGVVGQTVDTGIAYQIGQAVGSLALDEDAAPVVVGRDGRHSGPDLVAGLVEGLVSTGCDVINVGGVPTGALYYAAYEMGSGSGVMVTGSHNPPDYNGFKIMIGGSTLSGEAIRGLYERLHSGKLRSGKGEARSEDVLEKYQERIAGDIQLERPIKVVADCGNGIGGICAAPILRAIGAEVLTLFDEVDGTFPNHHPDPSEPENLEDLVQSVKLMNADIGVAFDGDADRLGVVTPDGKIVYPDRLMMLFARDILERHPGATIIYDVKCTGHLATVIAEAGGKPEMWKTGHSLIKKRMKEVGAPFAGEMSGHFFFQDRWYGFDCGIYGAARLLEILARDERSPGEVLASLPDSVSTPELKVQMAEGENHRFIERFQAEARFPDAEVSTIDGVRADFEDGWGLVRASNTTPVLVLRFDADSEESLARVQEAFREQLLALRADLDLPF